MTILIISVALQTVMASPVESTPAPATAEVLADQKPELAPAQLRTAVHAALRREATSEGPEHLAAIKELVVLHQQLGANQQMAPGARRQLGGLIGGRLRRAATSDDHGTELVELIERTIAPGSWESQGGLGRIMYWRNGRALVISQSQEAHEGLADLLQQLHGAQD